MNATTPKKYERREPEKTALYQVVQHEMESFIAEHEAADRYLPEFVTKQLEAFMKCGILCHGFVLKECQECRRQKAVAFSCKRRGLCPSCAGRRMAETAANLVDFVLPFVPVRQWTVTLPFSLRYMVAYDADLCREVHELAVRAIYRWMRQRAKTDLNLPSSKGLECGSVGFIHRARGDLALSVHFHILVADGVYLDNGSEKAPTFRGFRAPDRQAVDEISARLQRQVCRLLQRRGLLDSEFDAFADQEPVLACCASAALRGTSAGGKRAGQRIRRIRDESLQRHSNAGISVGASEFNIHASDSIPASARDRLERACRYAARGPIAGDRLEIRGEDTVVYGLKRPWSDGTTAVVLSFHELMERLVALIPRPHINMTIYCGVLGARHRLRHLIVPCEASETEEEEGGRRAGQWFPWNELLRRVFLVDVLRCSHCGGAFQHLNLVVDPDSIKEFLRSRGLPTAPPPRTPARYAQSGLDFDECDQRTSHNDHWDAA